MLTINIVQIRVHRGLADALLGPAAHRRLDEASDSHELGSREEGFDVQVGGQLLEFLEGVDCALALEDLRGDVLCEV